MFDLDIILVFDIRYCYTIAILNIFHKLDGSLFTKSQLSIIVISMIKIISRISRGLSLKNFKFLQPLHFYPYSQLALNKRKFGFTFIKNMQA